jgi:hypothetical protein
MIFDLLPYVACACFFFWTGLVFGGIGRQNEDASQRELDIDDAYADGYEQRIQDERMGIQRLPTHRP